MIDLIKIATVNCQGLGTPSKRQDVLNFYKKQGFSILSLQDTHFILVDLNPLWKHNGGTNVFLVHTDQTVVVLVLCSATILN